MVNLFDALADVAPELRHLSATFGPPSGMVCDGMHIQLGSGRAASRADKRGPQVLSLSLVKLDATRLMAVLSDVTDRCCAHPTHPDRATTP